MEKLKYLIQFILISFLFIIFKIIGISFSRYLASIIFIHLGPIFRSKKIVNENISKVFPNKDNFFKKTDFCPRIKIFLKISHWLEMAFFLTFLSYHTII